MKRFVGVLVMGAILSGCAGWGVFSNCIKQQAPKDFGAALVAVASIASQPSGYVADLLAFGKQIGPGTLDCVVQALVADTKNARLGTMLAHLHEYLQAKAAMGELNTECRVASL